MKMFGGPGKSKQSCKMRKCLLFVSSLKNSSISTLAASSTSVLASSSKVMSIRSGSWKDRNPGRSKKREEKRKAMRNLVLNYYTMSTDVFLEAAITFFNEF